MSFLNPLGLLWLGSLPVLLWLWRMTSTHRRRLVSSLIPFEHLLQRQAKRRTRLVVNALFWLQFLALCGISLALAQPLLSTHRSTVTLAVLDTSASMQAAHRGATRFAHAKQRLLRQLSRKGAFDQWLIMTTAPVTPLVPEPTNDAVTLRRAVTEARVVEMGGNLAATVRMGRALLRATPTKTLIITDEAPPTQEQSPDVEWHAIGQPRANVAFVGLETQGPFCELAQARVIATVQNFSSADAQVTVRVRQRSKLLAEERATVAPHAQWPCSLTLSSQIEGVVELSLATKGDALDVDDRAWVAVQRAATLPIVIDSSRPAFTQAISTWLSACPSLTWSAQAPPDAHNPHLLITDREPSPESTPVSLMTFLPPQTPRPVLSRWAVLADHPIGSYLAPLETVAAAVNVSDPGHVAGISVIDALVDGRRIPVVIAGEHEGHRHVVVRLDPALGPPPTPVVLTFLNSLRWLMESTKTLTTGEPLTVHGFAPGEATIRDPSGSTHLVDTQTGIVRYEHTDRAGIYQVIQPDQQRTVAVNFLDPLESNLLEPASTWAAPPASPTTTQASTRPRLPLGRLMIWLLLMLLLIEWWLYSAKHSPQSVVRGPT